jgi:hypothetical protein
VCAIGNFGYALNDLYDIAEDARAGRVNAVATLGRRRTGAIVFGSAMLAVLLAAAAAGVWGVALTVVEIALPLAYSIPPFRLKERKWLGVAADGLAAHVYPALLALITVSYLGVRQLSPVLVACVLMWSGAVGIRGILSHQLHTAERDRRGGLKTVVDDYGRIPLERFIAFVLVPIEAIGFVGAAAASNGGLLLWTGITLYGVAEIFRALNTGFTVTALRPEGQRYIPLVEESFYKAWGPIVISCDAARVDPLFLLVIPLYVLLFRPHLSYEMNKFRVLRQVLTTPTPPG